MGSNKEQLKGDVSTMGRSSSLARPLACSQAISCLEQVQRRGEYHRLEADGTWES